MKAAEQEIREQVAREIEADPFWTGARTARDYAAAIARGRACGDLIGTCPDGSRCQAPRECVAARACTRITQPTEEVLMSDTRNHTTRDQLAKAVEREYGCKPGYVHEGYGAECSSHAHAAALYRTFGCDHAAHLADALLASDAIAAVRAAAVAETTAAIEALAAKWESETEPYLPGGRRYEASGDTLRARADCRRLDAEHLRAALSGGRTALDTRLTQAWDEGHHEGWRFEHAARNPYRADTGADQ